MLNLFNTSKMCHGDAVAGKVGAKIQTGLNVKSDLLKEIQGKHIINLGWTGVRATQKLGSRVTTSRETVITT